MIETQGCNLAMTVFDPAGELQREVSLQDSAPTRHSLLSGVSGEFSLVISAPEELCEQSYRLGLETLRLAEASDEARIAAEKAFEEAEQLRWEWRKDASLEAIQKYDKALEYWEETGETLEEARTLRAIGDVAFNISEVKKALDSYESALGLFRELNDDRGEALTLSNMSVVHRQAGEKEKAFEVVTEALRLNKACSYERGEAEALTNLGEWYYYSGDNKSALDLYQSAMELFIGACDSRGEASARVNSAFVYSDAGDEAKSLEGFQKVLSVADAIGDRRLRAIALTGLGTRYAKLGENQRSLAYYSEAGALLENMGDVAWELATIAGKAYVYDQMGLTREALLQYKKSLRLLQRLPHPHSVAHFKMRVGQAYLTLEDNQKALEYLLAALETIRALGDPRSESVALSEIGRAYHSLGESREALDFLAQGLALSERQKDKREEAHLLTYSGSIYRELGETEKALRYLRRALVLNRETADRWSESWTLYNIASAERDIGNIGDAIEQTKQALNVAESLRTDVASDRMRTSYFASVHDVHELHVDLLMMLHAQDKTGGHDAAAIHAYERGRARSLADRLSEASVDVRHGFDPDLVRQEQQLKQQLNAKAKQQLEFLEGRATEDQLTTVANEIRELTLEYDQLQGRMRSASPRYAALTQPESLTLEEIQAEVLDEDTVLLEYALGDERSYLWAIHHDRYESHVLPARADIEETVQRVYSLSTARQPLPEESVSEHRQRVRAADAQYWEDATRLSEMVLGPVAAQLGGKRLLVVSDGALQYLPFGALPIPGTTDGPRPLVVEHEIVSMPSASTLSVLRQETKGRKAAMKAVAVLADPVFEMDDPRLGARATKPEVGDDQATRDALANPEITSDLHRALRDFGFIDAGKLRIPRLPFSGQEAAAIVSASPESSFKAVGFQANRDMATDPTLGDYRVVHFATHGILNNEFPELSGIVLSMLDEQAQPRDGFLRLHDIYNLKLPVDLVVLSACNSGLGKQYRGEGLVGIVRGFMYAGAERVVASLWKVDDEATGELMKRFYHHMFTDDMSPAAALRKAQVEMWRQKEWQAPFYWAAFVIQGDWQ
jgi:CHAT domain-containing protein/tetratricopeptide (TPR) repeat protein